MATTAANSWEIPEPLSVLEVRPDDDNVIALRRYGNPAGPRLVLSHGNGLAIDLYFPFWSLLMDDFDLIVHDLRNHGRNNVGPIANHHMPAFIQDHNCILAAIDETYGKKPKIGVYHSVSALAALMSNSTLMNTGSPENALATLVLFDPPLYRANHDSPEQVEAATEKSAAMIRRRANRFKTREQYVELLEFMPIFRNVLPGVRELMARATLREAADGNGYELCCPPDYEALIVKYIGAVFPLVELMGDYPMKAICADPTLPYSYLPTIDLSGILNVDYDFLPDTSHLMQVEQPEQCVVAMREFLEQQALPGL